MFWSRHWHTGLTTRLTVTVWSKALRLTIVPPAGAAAANVIFHDAAVPGLTRPAVTLIETIESAGVFGVMVNVAVLPV